MVASAVLGPVADASQHALTHEETENGDGLDDQTHPPRQIPVAFPHDEPGRGRRNGCQVERPGEVVRGDERSGKNAASKDQRAGCFGDGDGQCELGCEPDGVADLEMLPLGVDRIRAVDVTTTRFSSMS